jgi:hypothetical protein
VLVADDNEINLMVAGGLLAADVRRVLGELAVPTAR